MESVLEIEGVTKRFGAVLACNDVSLAVVPGEVRGLLGQNGAGKSTLMKIVAGIQHSDRGVIRVGGHVVPPADPSAARLAGVGMVHQHFSLVEPLTVWENVTLGEGGRLDQRAAVGRVRELGEQYGLEVDPYARVGDLAPGERQRVEIVKCLRNDPRLIILDEPTSVLTQAESKRLFEVLTVLVRDSRRAIVLISHRLEEVLEVTNRITVLRDGAVVSTLQTVDANVQMLVTQMLGRTVSLRREGAALGLGVEEDRDDAGGAGVAQPASSEAPVVADEQPASPRSSSSTARSWSRPTATGARRARPARVPGRDLRHRRGRGQRSGRVGRRPEWAAPPRWRCRDRRRDAHAEWAPPGSDPDRHRPPDRHAAGCVLQLSIAENLVLDRPEEVERFGLLSKRLMRERAERLVADFGISTPGRPPRRHAVRWEPATGRPGPRALADAEAARRLATDAGPRRRRDGGHLEAPPGGRGVGSGRLAHLDGSRRDHGALRPGGGDLPRTDHR